MKTKTSHIAIRILLVNWLVEIYNSASYVSIHQDWQYNREHNVERICPSPPLSCNVSFQIWEQIIIMMRLIHNQNNEHRRLKIQCTIMVLKTYRILAYLYTWFLPTPVQTPILSTQNLTTICGNLVVRQTPPFVQNSPYIMVIHGMAASSATFP